MTLSRSDVRTLLDTHGIRPTRSLGQNFVVDPNTVRRIVRLAEIDPGAPVVEVGAGLGSLTVALTEAGATVVAIEVDGRLVRALKDVVAGRPVLVHQADALTLDWEDLLESAARSLGVPPVGRSWNLVANLPYYAATPVVIRVLEESASITKLTVMVQQEVGERLVAGPGEGAYGAVSVMVDYWATRRLVGRVPPTVFMPRPKVDSVLVQMQRRSEPAVDPRLVPYPRLKEVVRAGFGQRRKTLRRALAGVVAPEAFEAAGVAPSRRAETLDVGQWGRLAAPTVPTARGEGSPGEGSPGEGSPATERPG